MNAEAEAAQLRRDVRYLMDRAAILDCISTHARGNDRHDADLTSSAYHADGWDMHGHKANRGSEYGEWANTVHAASAQSHTHNITTHSCDIDGDIAHSESYVVVGLLAPDGTTTTLMGGRYIDRLERRDGAWRIAVRRSVVDWTLTGDATVLAAKAFRKQGYVKGTWDKRDLAYQRPLDVDSAVERW